jgi:glycosyltransferase involved in cell wall biosynthesis
MRIGIDARELCGRPTGVGRHLAGLLSSWADDSVTGTHSFVLYAHEPVVTPLRQAAVRVIAGSPGTRWEQVSLPAAAKHDRLDVFFAPGYTMPLTLGVPTVVLVHDISFVVHPDWFRWREGLRRRVLTRWSCRRARHVLTVSDAARDDIISAFGISPDRVRRVYPGVVTLAAASDLQREAMVLFVGSVFNRRHLPDLIRGFRPIAMKDPATRLVIVGDNRTHPYEDLAAIAAREGIATRVSIRPYVADTELAALYRQAATFALLSEYEGFGHPPLEALACGVPPVVMDTRVAREVYGDAALYVPRDDVPAITSALNQLLFEKPVRQKVLGAAPAVLARYSWNRAATETLEILEGTASHGARYGAHLT